MTRRLMRSMDDKILGGVCGGLAEYFRVDSTLIRLAAAFLIFFSTVIPGLAFYIVAWIIIPRNYY